MVCQYLQIHKAFGISCSVIIMAMLGVLGCSGEIGASFDAGNDESGIFEEAIWDAGDGQDGDGQDGDGQDGDGQDGDGQDGDPEPAFSKWDLWSNGTVLRGANIYQQDEGRDDGASEAGWGPHIEADDLLELRQQGANFVNYSIPGTYHVLSSEPWPQMKQHLSHLVQMAMDADLFIVIAFRTGPGRGEGDITDDGLNQKTVFTNTGQQQAWVSMWQEVASEYADNKFVVGYDLMVEPHDIDVSGWRSFAQDMIDGIRTIDHRTPILVSPADWGGYDALEGWEPLSDFEGKLVYTVHQYEPYRFTHQSQNLTTGQLESSLDTIYGAIRNWMDANGAQVTVNEFGLDVSKIKTNSVFYMDRQLELLESGGLNHAVWEWIPASASWHDFDIRGDADYFQLFKDDWQLNEKYPGDVE